MSAFKSIMKARKLKFSWLAEELGLNRSSTTRWATVGVPAERVLDVERVTGISRHDIRPDIYPLPSRKSATKSREARP